MLSWAQVIFCSPRARGAEAGWRPNVPYPVLEVICGCSIYRCKHTLDRRAARIHSNETIPSVLFILLSAAPQSHPGDIWLPGSTTQTTWPESFKIWHRNSINALNRMTKSCSERETKSTDPMAKFLHRMHPRYEWSMIQPPLFRGRRTEPIGMRVVLESRFT